MSSRAILLTLLNISHCTCAGRSAPSRPAHDHGLSTELSGRGRDHHRAADRHERKYRRLSCRAAGFRSAVSRAPGNTPPPDTNHPFHSVRPGGNRARRLSLRMVRSLQRCRKSRPLGGNQRDSDVRNAKFGKDPRARHRGSATLQQRPLDARRRSFPRRMRLLPRRARRSDRSDRAKHVAFATGPFDVDAGVARPGAVLDRQDTASSTPACRPGWRRSGRRSLGRGRISQATSHARCSGLSRTGAGRAVSSPAERRRNRHHRGNVRSRERVRALPRGEPAADRTASLVPVLHGQPAAFLHGGARGLRACAPCERHHAAAGERSFAPKPRAGRALLRGARARRPRRTGWRTRKLSNADACWRRSGDPGARSSSLHGLPQRVSARSLSASFAGQHAVYMANRLRLWKGGLHLALQHRPDHGADRPVSRRAADR